MNLDRSQIVMCDTETTGLDPDRHQIWEVGVIHWVPVVVPPGHSPRLQRVEKRWFLPVDLTTADTMALRIGRFHERHPNGVHFPRSWSPNPQAVVGITPLEKFAREFVQITDGKHLVGAVISFDDQRLSKLLRAAGQPLTAHYHSLEIEAMVYGFLSHRMPDLDIPLPFKSDDLSDLLGVDRSGFEEHTALGDCRWVEAQLLAMEDITRNAAAAI